VARSLAKSVGVISATLPRAMEAGLDWEAVGALSDEALDGRMYGVPGRYAKNKRVVPLTSGKKGSPAGKFPGESLPSNGGGPS